MRCVNCESFSIIQRHGGLFTGTPPQKENRAEFFKPWFENNLHRLRMHFLSIGFCKQTNKQRMTTFSLSNIMQRKKGSKRIEMIIKMVNEFKLTIVHFARANPMQICACAWIYRWTRKNVEKNQDTGPPGRRAARPLGLRTAGPSRVVGNLVPRSPTATFQCKTE